MPYFCFLILFFLSLYSASLDAFPKEDKVVRIHDFFSIICYYNIVNLIKWMFDVVLLIAIFQKEIIC